jgi:hypothetical protein
MIHRLLIPLIFALTALGCAPPASVGGLNSPDPASKLYAIRAAGESRDRTAIPALVEQLENDDPAVRVFSINALERITGERLGYNPYADDVARRASVERWVEAVKNNRFAQGPVK